MTYRLLVAPVSSQNDLAKESVRLVKLFLKQGYRVVLFEPVSDQTNMQMGVAYTTPQLEYMLAQGKWRDVLQHIEECYQEIAKNADVVVIRGMAFGPDQSYVRKLNARVARAFDADVAIAASSLDSGERTNILLRAYRELPLTMARDIDEEWVRQKMKKIPLRRVTPSLFRFGIIDAARKANRRILLPEGTEPRTLQAALICADKRLAHCVLMGKRTEIESAAKQQGLSLNNSVEILEPTGAIIEKYVEPMMALRAHKHLTAEQARAQLQDLVILATMMVQQGDADGLVSGATHTTAETVRPALQLIKTAENATLVSSVFFMCLETRVLVFADCAVRANPTAEELADIAIKSADTAATFEISPKIAMISYSTYDSGAGPDVERVKQATALVRKKRPDLIVDGPLQYDTAIDPRVAALKAPKSPVAGEATVFIFPDLDVANTVYKAVQRTADIVCVGPMLQGLKKPVNDLSRGCSVEDIVFTIAITAIQAKDKK